MSFSFPAPLYPIIDTLGESTRSHLELADAIFAAGAPLVQLRVKDQPSRRFVEIARAVKAVADRHSARLIINDRADIAKLIDAAGVHLGQHDLPAAAARRILGPGKLIGVSTHNLAQAKAVAQAGIATYLGFGPIYSTTSKDAPDPVQGLEALRQVRDAVQLPIVAIGGIRADTMADVLAAGADAVAMIGAIVRAADITRTVEALLQTAARKLAKPPAVPT